MTRFFHSLYLTPVNEKFFSTFRLSCVMFNHKPDTKAEDGLTSKKNLENSVSIEEQTKTTSKELSSKKQSLLKILKNKKLFCKSTFIVHLSNLEILAFSALHST